MSDVESPTVLAVVATAHVDEDLWAGLVRRLSPARLRIAVPAHVGGDVRSARRILDTAVNFLVELEVPATGTIGPRGADAIRTADAELADGAIDEAVLILAADEPTADWELQIARDPVLRHGVPIAVIGADGAPEAA